MIVKQLFKCCALGCANVLVLEPDASIPAPWRVVEKVPGFGVLRFCGAHRELADRAAEAAKTAQRVADARTERAQRFRQLAGAVR